MARNSGFTTRKRQGYAPSICWDCRNACGGCEWSEIDPETERPRFQPVPGWTAKPVTVTQENGTGAKPRIVSGYCISKCPKFLKLPEREEPPCKTLERAVVSIDQDGNEREFSSVSEATRITGIKGYGIISVCKKTSGHNTAGGYRWRYAEEYERSAERSAERAFTQPVRTKGGVVAW